MYFLTLSHLVSEGEDLGVQGTLKKFAFSVKLKA